ncbi:MAG: hypothetical protein IKO61_00630 [Lachnospiraceae bacterium]|nr:hypothetical protein [Lachnospiraceae bacterium]
MNKTTKAKYDVAERMLKGRIDVDEVVMMTGLDKKLVEELKEKVVPRNPDAEVLEKLDTVDLDIGPIIYDNTPAESPGIESLAVEDDPNVPED